MERPSRTTPDRRLFFICLAVGVYAIICIQGAEANKRSKRWEKWFFSKRTIQDEFYYPGIKDGSKEAGEVPWWKVVLVVFAIVVLGFCFLLLYFYCKDPPDVEDQRAANVENFLKKQEELRNGHHSAVDQPPATNGQVQQKAASNGSCLTPPPDCPEVTAPLLPQGDISTEVPLEAPPPFPADYAPSQISIVIPPNDQSNGSVHFGRNAGTE